MVWRPDLADRFAEQLSSEMGHSGEPTAWDDLVHVNEIHFNRIYTVRAPPPRDPEPLICITDAHGYRSSGRALVIPSDGTEGDIEQTLENYLRTRATAVKDAIVRATDNNTRDVSFRCSCAEGHDDGANTLYAFTVYWWKRSAKAAAG